MTATRTKASPRQPRRTHCNLAALMALGLLAGTAGPALAVQSTSSTTLLNNVILRGLVSDYRTSATFAQSSVPTGQTLTITQLLPKIILDWNKFNLANGDTIQFIQPSSSAAVLNRIYDADPTKISGAIKANGQVYLVNQNGILFNRGTQIDTNSFFASTLNITDEKFKAGFGKGDNFTPAFEGRYDVTGATTTTGPDSGGIVVGGGSSALKAPTINAAAGGAVVIIAPVIDNKSGIIKSPNGQVILAAGRAAFLSFPTTDTTASFRGMLVEVKADKGAPLNLSDLIKVSTVTNSGTISADGGNVTLAGLAINQLGRVSAASALLSNGSIYLQARTIDNATGSVNMTGQVNLSANSVTETPLDTSDTTTLKESASFDPYRPVVTITGKTIDVEGRITSPSGKVSLNALQDSTNVGTPRIYLGDGSLIDASGAWSTASDASNLLTFKVTSTELKTAPDQQNGALLGATVTVDLRQGSNVLDLQGYQANQNRTLQQKAAVGGVVTFNSSGDVVERSDAAVDVSGGGVHYTGVTEATSKLLGADGKLYDIASAPEALRYTGLADSFTDTQSRWGFSPVYTNLLMGASTKRPDYTEGAAGGQLKILTTLKGSGAVLDGKLLGGATTGSQQTGAAPRGAALVIGGYDSQKDAILSGIGDVTFQSGAPSSLPAGFTVYTPLSDARKTQLSLSTDVFAAGTVDAAGNYVTTGFGSVEINANGRVTVPENVTISGPLGGALTMHANQVEIDGHVNVPAGTVIARSIGTTGSVEVNQGAGISTAGEWINSSTTGILSPVPSGMFNPSTDGATPVASSSSVNGGSIALQGPVVQLATDSTLDVSAGGSVSTKSAFVGGAAGSISLTATATPTATTVPLMLDGTLAGYGFGSGGTLSLSTSDAVQIAAASTSTGSSGLSLGSAFFDQGGFQSYNIIATGDLTVLTGANVRPRQQSLQVDLPTALGLATGGGARSASTLVTLTDDVRKPTSLLLSSSGALTVKNGSRIDADVGAAVTLSGLTGLSVGGTISAPGGTIALSDSFGGVSANLSDSKLPVIELGSQAILSTHGTFTAQANDKGLTLGSVSAGGTVSVNASAAHLLMDSGSVIDVGGATQLVDLPAVVGSSVPYRQAQQSSNAGTVSITANDSVVMGGTIRANADASAAGGTFNLTLNERGDIADPTTGRRIVVTQSGATQSADAAFKDVAVSVDKLRGGGFDKVNLAAEDRIVFADTATLAFQRGVTLDTKLVQVAGDANVGVSGAAVKLADSFGVRVLKTQNDPTDLSTNVDKTKPSVPQATSAGTGMLRVNADTLDVAGSVTVSGTRSVTLSAVHDLRLSGRPVGQATDPTGQTLVGGLVAVGDLTLDAAQVYPTTNSTFTVTDAIKGQLTVRHGAGVLGDVLSAGGSLTLQADRIDQEGVVEAPLGTINLQAATTLTLGSTSVTSVSANGLTIPYGETVNGVNWYYGSLGNNPLTKPSGSVTTSALTAPPAKNISLNAPAVDVLTGAKVDVSGGGDVAAIEYVKTGNATDALVAANTYAILPAANLSAVPVDADIAARGGASVSGVYNSIHIGPGGAVPAGDYFLLPGYYGLLKGGYIVQLLTGSTYANLQNGQTATLQNGVTVVPGVLKTAGTGVASSATIGVEVRPNTAIPNLSSYTVSNSAYFATLAEANRTAVPALPADGGQLSIAATQRLTLNGTLEANLPGADSRSAQVDISAAKIALVDQVGRGDVDPSYLQIDSAGLSKLNADLLIGGVRSTSGTGEVVTTTASDIIVANSQSRPLDAPALTLAATDSITVRSGSSIEGAGQQVVKPVDFTVAGTGAASGAILRASTGGLVNITRPTTDSSQGTVTIEAGATVAADGSLALDATRTTKSSGTLNVAKGGALALVSGSVSLGETDGVTGLDSGLVLDNAELAKFSGLGTLSLKSYGGITLYGNAQVGSSDLINLVLDGASLTGQSPGATVNATIAATNISLVNTSGRDAAPGAGGKGTLSVIAKNKLTLGTGSKQVAGYADTRLSATGDGKAAPGEIIAAGTGSLQAASTLELTAARISSVSGADQGWTAQDASASGGGYKAVTIAGNATSVKLADATGLGSRLQVTGASVADSGNIIMKSGAIALEAVNGDVSVSGGAVLDAGGASKDFQGTIATADAGQVRLNARQGKVIVDKSSTVNLAASDLGGNAGTLSVSAVAADLSGSFKATSATGTQGGVTLDLVTLDDVVSANTAATGFSALNTMLNGAGFTESRDIRVRNQDVTVAATDVVQAHHLTLESDAGDVKVLGRLDASAAQGGGSVAVTGTSVTVASGATINASGTSPNPSSYANGGSVSLIAETGTLDFDKGAMVDVSAGAAGSAGGLLLRAPRTTLAASTLDGQVKSHRNNNVTSAQIVVEGNQVYQVAAGASLDSTDFGHYGDQNMAFMAAIAKSPLNIGITDDDGAVLGSVHVRPAVELKSPGDLTIAQDWNLTGTGWRITPAGGSGVEAGSLVVRAAGNLTLAGASVGNPDTTLQTGPTWNIALTSGADLDASKASRVQSTASLAGQAVAGSAGAGDLVLDSSVSEASLRTGTGNIDIAAGRDFVIKAGVDPITGNPTPGVVYTSGVAAIKDPQTSAADYRFTQGGGDVTITAQRDAIGSGNEWLTDWYRQATTGDGGFTNGVWWSVRQNFHDGVAALGGGNVSLSAGRDLRDLSAWAPTSAIQSGTGSAAALQTFGGGNLNVQAGNDIVGGQFLVGLGQGTVTAGGDIGGANQSSQLFLMGASGDAARSGATASLKAGGNVNLASIDNPGLVYQTIGMGIGPSFSGDTTLSILSYSSNSAVNVSALSGNLRIGNSPNAAPLLNPSEDILGQQANVSNGVTVLPPRVDFTVFDGSITYTGSALSGGYAAEVLFPSIESGARLLAGKGVVGMSLRVSDADPGQFDVPRVDQANTTSYSDVLNGVGGAAAGRLVTNRSTDVFINDVVALDGSITGVTFNFPSRARLWASQDISDAGLSLQNLTSSDVSELVAQNGSIAIKRPEGWGINGPGALLLQAGQNIDLGAAPLTSFGNLRNSALASTGADIDLLAGYSGTIDLTKLYPTFKALQDAGSAKKPDDATAAIDQFLDKALIGKGDIESFNTGIQSSAGGSINLMAPGGNITVGLPTPNTSKLIGVVTIAGGAINSFLKGDFNINQGKVLTAQGGNILIYTTDGGIDAGRGAKTSVTTPPPVRTPVIEGGVITGYTYSLPVAVAGSGIQTATSKPGGPDSVAPPAGDIYLFAPKGTIDAGEAGIKSGGAIFVAALTVLNADNISSVGASTGVPVTPPGSVASTVAASTGTATVDTKTNDAVAQAAAAAAAAGVTNFRPAILTVEVMGFGDKNCKETDKDCFAK